MKLLNLGIILILFLPIVSAGQAAASFTIPEGGDSITGAVVGVQDNCVRDCVEAGGTFENCQIQCLPEEGFFVRIFGKIKTFFSGLF